MVDDPKFIFRMKRRWLAPRQPSRKAVVEEALALRVATVAEFSSVIEKLNADLAPAKVQLSRVAIESKLEIIIDADGKQRMFRYEGAKRYEVAMHAPAEVQPVLDSYKPSMLIDMFVPIDRAQDMHANLDDLFPVWARRHGQSEAVWIKRIQILLLVGGTWWEKIVALAERLLKVARLSG